MFEHWLIDLDSTRLNLKPLAESEDWWEMGYEACNNHPYHAKKTLTVDRKAMPFERAGTVADERVMAFEVEGTVTMTDERVINVDMVVTVGMAMTDGKALTVGRYRPQVCG